MLTEEFEEDGTSTSRFADRESGWWFEVAATMEISLQPGEDAPAAFPALHARLLKEQRPIEVVAKTSDGIWGEAEGRYGQQPDPHVEALAALVVQAKGLAEPPPDSVREAVAFLQRLLELELEPGMFRKTIRQLHQLVLAAGAERDYADVDLMAGESGAASSASAIEALLSGIEGEGEGEPQAPKNESAP